jgi:FPC/CPF motif-containing protein YcgG
VIVFNPESQIRRLKEEQQFEQWVETIRDRDIKLQGYINPSIPATADTIESEARVYFGKPNPHEGWECPFQARPDVVDPKAPRNT